jgi:hypothetical protein
VRIPQFRLHEQYKTCKTCEAKHAKLANFSHVSLWFRIVLYGSCKRNCGLLTLFRLVLLIIASLEFVFAYFLFRFALFRIFFVKRKRDTLDVMLCYLKA